MAIVVDTCSLVMLAKNYFPIDKSGKLSLFMEDAFSKGELLLLDTIRDEARRVSKGIAIKEMPYLIGDRKIVIKTTDMLPPSPKKFDNMIDNNFCIGALKKELTEEEYIQQKDEFMKSGDAKILVYCWTAKGIFDDCCVMTEESRFSNDSKLFKKLPILCEYLGIKNMTVVEYLLQNGFKIER